MITVSVCMIVKNEEERLGRCLDSLKDIADEIIVVDTGSVDATMDIAGKYTDRIYEFEWTGSFSDARNYAFSLATGDYIYSADADEEVDEDNQKKFLILKEVLGSSDSPAVDIVQMYYCNQLENNTIYSFDRELRPKLYKRVRSFTWEETIHEAVRLEPVIYDSDIDIIHRPGKGHAKRDLKAFERLIEERRNLFKSDDSGLMEEASVLSKRLTEIYAKELIIAGEEENFLKAKDYFCMLSDGGDMSEDECARAFTMAAKCCRVAGDINGFIKYALRAAAGNIMTSELCYELGDYYEKMGDIKEAVMWYYNAAAETSAYMDLRYEKELPVKALEKLGGPIPT